MKSVHPAAWFAGGVLVAVLSSSWPARADPPATSACVTFNHANISEKNTHRSIDEDESFVSVTELNAADAYSRWIDRQLAAGRSRFTLGSGVGGTAICAW